MKIILAIPPVNTGRSWTHGCYAPRGIWSIATYLNLMIPGLDIEILDGNLMSQKQLTDRVLISRPDLLGISVHTTLSYPNCLELLRIACNASIPVVMGGTHISCIPQLVVQSQKVDIIYGQGEIAFARYVQWFINKAGQAAKAEIPNLCWPDNNEIITNAKIEPKHLCELPPLNPNLLDLRPYWQNAKGLQLPTNKTYVLFTHEGCKWRDKSGGCKFCALSRPCFYPSPESVWEEIKTVIELYGGPIWFKDYGDNLNHDFVKKLADTKPWGIEPSKDYFLEVYIRANEVKEIKQARLLKEIGVNSAFIGFESANNKILRLMNKGETKKDYETAVRLLVEAGIGIIAFYVLGMEKESVKTLTETLVFAKWIKDQAGSLLKISSASPVCVLPGTQMWQQLIEKEPQYSQTDNPDIEQAQLDWFKHFCELSNDPQENRNLVIEFAREINNLTEAKNYFGWEDN